MSCAIGELIRTSPRICNCSLQSTAILAILSVGAFNVCAQGQQPDYSGVNDVLDGRRSLVAVNDVVIGGLVFKTSDGTKIEDQNIYNLPDFKIHKAFPQVLARMFDSANDTLLYAHANIISAIDPNSKATKSITLTGDE